MSPKQLLAAGHNAPSHRDMPTPLIPAAGGTAQLRDVWEATSFQLERLQTAEECVEAEQAGLAQRTTPRWNVPFTPARTPDDKLQVCPRVLPACTHMAHDFLVAWLESLPSEVQELNLPGCGMARSRWVANAGSWLMPAVPGHLAPARGQ